MTYQKYAVPAELKNRPGPLSRLGRLHLETTKLRQNLPGALAEGTQSHFLKKVK